jgi:predicted Rdx family selenoprotein
MKINYSVWFYDLDKVLKVFREKCPQVQTFTSIEGNAYGDFVIRSSTGGVYIIKHSDFSIWHRDENWKNNKWTEIA